MKEREKRRRHAVKRGVLLIFALCLAFFAYSLTNQLLSAANSTPAAAIVTKKADTNLGWSLILVNSENSIPEDYEVELTRLSNGQKVDSRIYPSLQKMFDDMRAQGYSPEVVSGYRTAKKQQSLFDDKLQTYRDSGYSEKKARTLAEKWVAAVGTSEHQLGIAVDINEKNVKQTSDEFYEWLNTNAYKYGFIQRYPADKTDITGISNEPWHYRYVGEAAAAEMYSLGICLEEYISLMGN